ncbi:hypothetical protein [Erythrobacter sp. F6033]|uniref:hypothetical protein n=1 Tax=Erythrobacter sp. F6033 TaxID=2926401 RepID=UPI001FF4FD86|nr:hypothetical protein [Erythrobacter sp. F6033]MCK0127440.1 hypothetical protein [Erythrobacter sp. F6033]
MNKTKELVDSKDEDEKSLIPKRFEQLSVVIANGFAIVAPLATWLSGLPASWVVAIGLLIFLVLIVLVVVFASREPNLVRGLSVAAVLSLAVAIAAEVSGHSGNEFPATDDAIKPAPPRIEIQAWLDRPTLESDGKGAFIELTGDGVKGHQEPSLTPVEVFTPDRVNSTNIYRSPGYFSPFEPGQTVTAKICGLEFQKVTYPRSDKRYQDVIIWDIPVPASQEENC